MNQAFIYMVCVHTQPQADLKAQRKAGTICFISLQNPYLYVFIFILKCQGIGDFLKSKLSC